MKKDKWKVVFVDECDSTNSHIKHLKAKGELTDRTALMTYFQHKGRGQGKNNWYSSKEKNLLASFYRVVDMPVKYHYMLNIIVSLAVKNVLKNFNIEAKVKWPNDIYCGEKKIAGILIENVLMRDRLAETIIGVGLNVNEEEFPDSLPNPCSMHQLKNKSYDLNNIAELITVELDALHTEFVLDNGEQLFHEYQSCLYRLNQWHLFKVEGKTINARIRGVELDGRLLLETNAGSLRHFLFGEIEHVIN